MGFILLVGMVLAPVILLGTSYFYSKAYLASIGAPVFRFSTMLMGWAWFYLSILYPQTHDETAFANLLAAFLVIAVLAIALVEAGGVNRRFFARLTTTLVSLILPVFLVASIGAPKYGRRI